MKKKAISNLAALVCFVSAFFTLIITGTLSPLDSSAVSQDYPAVLLRISTHDNSRHMNISGYDDKAAVVLSEQKNTQNENWRFDYVGTDKNGSFYKITNMGTGRQITPMGYKVSEGTGGVIFGSETVRSQHCTLFPLTRTAMAIRFTTR